MNQTWFDNVQEEICTAIEEAGYALNSSDRGQLSDAIRNPTTVTTGGITINDTNNATSALTIKGVATSGSDTGATLSINSGRGSFPSSLTAVLSGDEVGRVAFGGIKAANTWAEETAYLSAVASRNWDTGDTGTSLVMGICDNGETTPDVFFTLGTNGVELTSTKEYRYDAAKSYTTYFNMLDGVLNASVTFSGFNNSSQTTIGSGTVSPLVTLNATGTILVPMRLPTDAIVSSVALFSNIGSSGASLVVEIRTTTTNNHTNTATLRGRYTRTSGSALGASFNIDPVQTITSGKLMYAVFSNIGSAPLTLSPFFSATYTIQTLSSEEQG